MFWYAVSDESRDSVGNYREYVLFELSQEEIETEQRIAESFRQLVGTHMDLDEAGHRVRGTVQRDEASWREFYDLHPPASAPSYADHEQVGRFRGSDLP
jgi:hypothetical protein